MPPSLIDRIILAAFCVQLISAAYARAQTIPAFPGADGAAASVTGGRGGIVYHVTKLDRNFNHNEPGTLRYGLNGANFGGQHRTIVFDVGGVFWLGRFGAEENHHNGWDTSSRYNLGSNVTVAGQTAPGGVYIMGGLVKAGGHNAILRNVTIAPGYGMRNFEKPDEDPPELPTPGDFPDSYVYDAIDITGTNLMIDHVTTIYATDETISANENANNITIQYSNISQGQNYPQGDAEASGIRYTGHALGSLLQAGSNAKVSVHHNLYAHLKGRLPRVGSEVGTGAYNDFRNNVFYNWLGTAGGGASGQPSFNNFVANFYLAGPGGDDPVGGTSTAITQRAGGTGIFNGSNSSGTRVYHADNLRDINKDGDADDSTPLANSNFGSSSFQPNPLWFQGEPTYTGVTDTATEAFERVLDYVGANWWTRDEVIDTVDERLIHEVRNGTGKIVAWADNPFNDDPNEGVEWRGLLAMRADPATGAAPFNRPADWDVDGDGMPGAWEQAHGLDPNTADHNGDFDNDGYTNLEEYINEIAAWPARAPLGFNGATSNRYAEITNWDVNPDATAVHNWQPSKYDEAHVRSGTAVVDAPGQHAGVLRIAPGSSETAQVDVAAGWLHADAVVEIGGTPTSTAALNLTGGTLRTPVLTKSDAGAFNFTGGRLHADAIGFDLINNGGTLATGHRTAGTMVNGTFLTTAGTTEIELASRDVFDVITVAGGATLGGNLHVLLLDDFIPSASDTFTILTATLVDGMFTNVAPDGRVVLSSAQGSFLVTIEPGAVTLSNFLTAPPILAGDYNDDGIVDAADYTVWRDHLWSDTALPNETASPGTVDQDDYDAWKANFGATSESGKSAAAIPEPATAALLLGTFCGKLIWRPAKAEGGRCIQAGHPYAIDFESASL